MDIATRLFEATGIVFQLSVKSKPAEALSQDDFYRLAREGTGQWFLQRDDFKTWTTCDETTLWCPGNPGAGKTFLALIVVEHMNSTRQSAQSAILVVYCGYNDARSQSVDNLIAALIKPILQIRPNVRKELKKLHEMHSRTDVFEIFPSNSVKSFHRSSILQSISKSSVLG